MERDANTTKRLGKLGWTVIRFWGHEILGDASTCATRVATILEEKRSRASKAQAGLGHENPSIAKAVQPVVTRASGRGLANVFVYE